MTAILITLRVVHIFSAAIFVGFSIFNYFLLRPSLEQIPPAHAVVVAQRTGSIFTIIGWGALSLLLLSGGLRLYYQQRLGAVFTLEFYFSGYGSSLGIMIFGWFVASVMAGIMTIVIRPRLIGKLAVSSKPTLSDVEKRRAAQIAGSALLEKLQLVNIAASSLALIAGASLAYGGLF